ncbi:energy transducer TonB [Lysobacter korlensis]|uniref:Energy transducer TonB n=1 Tax=Lysobacter korlensis TaxID=553636 RepID=A0ABV6RHW9_9GAMM
MHPPTAGHRCGKRVGGAMLVLRTREWICPMSRWIALIVLCLAMGAAVSANGPRAVRKQAESSLLVKGSIDITADGEVLAHTLEGGDTVPPAIAEMIGKRVSELRFEPVVLQPGTSRARAPMTVRVVAKKLDDDRYALQVRGMQFGSHAPGETVSSKSLPPPSYPESAAWGGVGGTVYVVVRIGRDGRVEDAIAEQVNLRVIDNESAMTKWRQVLAQSALQGARKWTFTPPQRGEAADAPYWSARVPVDYVAPGQSVPNEYKWHAYIPGPRTAIPWEPEVSAAGADALAAGGVHPIGQGLRLLTPIGEG